MDPRFEAMLEFSSLMKEEYLLYGSFSFAGIVIIRTILHDITQLKCYRFIIWPLNVIFCYCGIYFYGTAINYMYFSRSIYYQIFLPYPNSLENNYQQYQQSIEKVDDRLLIYGLSELNIDVQEVLFVTYIVLSIIVILKAIHSVRSGGLSG